MLSILIFIILVLIYLMFKSKTSEKIFFSLIIGGAIGNLYDRIIYKAVPDFIDFHIKEFHWFTFNIADIFISLGIIFMILNELIFNKQKMKIKYLLLFIFLVSCGAFSEAGKALRNEKTRTTDEFLIEKRGPLSLPPKMGELPKPRSDSEINKENKNILGVVSEGGKSEEKSELENIFLEEIRKK